MRNNIHINVADIPPEVGDRLGRVTLAGFKKFISNPENCKMLEAQMAADQQRKKEGNRQQSSDCTP